MRKEGKITDVKKTTRKRSGKTEEGARITFELDDGTKLVQEIWPLGIPDPGLQLYTTLRYIPSSRRASLPMTTVLALLVR